MVEFLPMGDFVAGGLHPAVYFVLVVRGTLVESVFQFLKRWGKHEEADDVRGEGGTKLAVSLPVDVENHVEAAFERCLDGCAWCPVPSAEDNGALQKVAAL
ncbi:hypothetical protein AA103196_0709 [Ameyamaea chiangmaiensis NBRC 103196]|nr:hypothetical protein AA103196_0709 [Ameyamaea chiangmaiensis NBRC 103196]